MAQKEGYYTLTVDLKDMDDISNFQSIMWEKIRGTLSDNEFGSKLNSVSLGTAVGSFFIPGFGLGLGIVSTATAFVSLLTSSNKAAMDEVLGGGLRNLVTATNNMRYNLTDFDRFEIELPYMDYTFSGKEMRFVQGHIGEIKLIKGHVKGGPGWVIF